MASDSQDSLRKHHRSPSDDDSPEKSKRRKHRHHRRHHRRHRHHRSKHDESKTDEIESEMKVDLGIAVNSAAYDDMEEGEIVEGGEINDAKDASDLESGELDDGYMRDAAAMNDVPMVDTDRKSDTILKSLSDSSGDNKKHRSHASVDESPESVSIANGNAVKSLGKSDKHRDKHRRESKEQPVELMEVDEEGRRNSYSLKTKDDRQVARYHSPRDRNRSETPDLKKDRDLHERRSRSRHHHVLDDGIYENGKVYDDLDEGRDSRVHTDYRIDRSERGNDRRRERSSSRHRSSMYENGDPFDMKGREREPLRVKTDRDLDSERERRGRDREKGRESDKDKNRGREARRVVDWDRERERDRDLKRDKDRGRSRDRDYDRSRRRDASISSLRDKDLDRERDRRQQSERDRDSYRGRDRHDSESERRRQHQYADNGNERGGRDRHHGYGEPEYMAGNRKYDSEKYRASKDEAVKEAEDKRDDDDQNDYEERVELKLAEQEEDDVDRIKEESRRRREAILKKYKAKELQQQVPQDAKESAEQVKEQPSQKSSSGNEHQEEGNRIKHDEEAFGVDNSHNVGKSPLTNENVAVKSDTGAGGLGEGSPKSERLSDMFCDDIFGDSPAGIRKTGKGDGLPVERSGLIDNWDDPEGYYSFRFGEILDGRYEVTAAHGKGVFSTVVRAKDLKAGSGDPEEVAIKIIRNNETMLKAGTEELVILKKLVGADPEDRRHCVRYLSNFKYRNHLCIVFESLHMNLREVLKKFGRNIGLKLTAVRTYAKQLFIALKHLRNCGVLHSDIKPDNMLVNEAKNVLKLCDFGNAMFAGKNEITPYLVSRFYRAPEIILGLPYDHPMDIWSIGCCLYEIYTGKVLFPGATNNDMLRLHMELKGPFPKKMLRKGAFVDPHFDQDFNFLAIEEDPVTKKAIRKVIFNIKPKDIGSIIMGSAGEDPKMLANFKDLLDKIFILDPDKRLTVSQALSHPFITGK